MKKSTQKALATGAAVAAISTAVPAAKFIASAAPISHEVRGSLPSGKMGFVAPDSLIYSAGNLYIPRNAKIVPANDAVHTLQLVNKNGETFVVVDCAYSVGGQPAPLPPNAIKIKIMCIK